MANKIPRQFNRIRVRMMVQTNVADPNDILHISKNDSGYLALNTRTGKYAYVFASHLRNSEVFELLEVE